MKKAILKFTLLLLAFVATNSLFAQVRPTLEWVKESSPNFVSGYSTSNISVSFLNDFLNPTVPTNAPTYTYDANPLVAVVSIVNQQRSTTLTNSSTVVPGITFGGRNTSDQANDTEFPSSNGVQTIGYADVFNVFAADIPASKPLNNMYITSPTAAAVGQTSNSSGGSSTTGGFDTQNITGAQGPAAVNNGSGVFVGDEDANFGLAIYTAAEPLADISAASNGRFYYGDVVIKFNRPVKDPVVHIGGLGGSYSYIGLDANTYNTYFTTELELSNGATASSSSLLAGNLNIALQGNNIVNTNATPNAGSVLGDVTYGAASGSVKVSGTYTKLVYKIFLKGTTGNFGWSQTQANITSATRDPFNGDLWYLSVSLDKPTQQVSGNVFIDRDGLKDLPLGDINKSAGVDNPTTNIGGSLFANLLNTSGQVVASTPIGPDGSYLFDNVPVGTYSVQLTTNASAGTYASPTTAPTTVLPTGWANTGEFVGNVAGNDGTVNGKSSSVVVGISDIKVEVNFGIERLPDSDPYTSYIATPLLNTVITLNGVLPVLTGSDPEDQPASGSLATKSVQITTLPTNSQLLYAGSPVYAGQIITSYDPALLQIRFNVAAVAIGETQFTYAYVDAAGIADPTPAVYIVKWPYQGPLPIILEEFAAIKNNCTANLVWKTSSEINSDKFEVEVLTKANTDFATIGSVIASGASSSSKNYQFSYAMQADVVYYFRLKMIKKDGTFTYSKIAPLSCENRKSEISVYPNPTPNTITIEGLAKGKNIVTLYTNQGRLVTSLTTSKVKDVIDMTTLASGTYMLKITNENGTSEVRTIVKQ
ncbi:MAG: T9SS type A sorting domain-containing protein [Ferruginibacter sp.]|nr:T9SS type A sorting domain-containing protein [Ferruginibacter sp.]